MNCSKPNYIYTKLIQAVPLLHWIGNHCLIMFWRTVRKRENDFVGDKPRMGYWEARMTFPNCTNMSVQPVKSVLLGTIRWDVPSIWLLSKRMMVLCDRIESQIHWSPLSIQWILFRSGRYVGARYEANAWLLNIWNFP